MTAADSLLALADSLTVAEGMGWMAHYGAFLAIGGVIVMIVVLAWGLSQTGPAGRWRHRE